MKKLLSVFVVIILMLQCVGCTARNSESSTFSSSVSETTTTTVSSQISQTESSKKETVSSEFASSVIETVVSKPVSDVSSKSTVSKDKTSKTETNSKTETTSNTESINSKPNVRTKYKGKDFDVTLTFTGDMILSSYLDQPLGGTFDEYAKKYKPSYFLSKVKHIFEVDDFTIVNLENVFSDRKGLKPRDKGDERAFWFKAQTKNLKILTEGDVEGVTLENNHTHDYGETGYRDTVKAVQNYGLKYGDNNKVMYFTKKGYTIGVVCVGLWGEYSVPHALNLLKAAKRNSHYQVVFFHGGTESVHKPDSWKKKAARQLVDNGADLVVGSHPHVLQPRETYKGVEIVYSLGNFCYGGNRSPENRTIIYQMKLKIGKDYKLKKSASQIIPCYVHTGSRSNFQPAPITNKAHYNKVMDFMDWKVKSPI